MSNNNGGNPMEGRTQKCGICGQLREKRHFFEMQLCIFCAIDRAEHNLSRLQDKLNFAPPNNGALKRNCRRCKDFVWWVNLNEKGYCPPCRDAIAEIAITPVSNEGGALELDIDDILSGLLKEPL